MKKRFWTGFLAVAAILGFAADFYWLNNNQNISNYSWIIGFVTTWISIFYLGYAIFIIWFFIIVSIIAVSTEDKVNETPIYGCIILISPYIFTISSMALIIWKLDPLLKGHLSLYLWEYPKIAYEWIKYLINVLIEAIIDSSKIT